jgi:hypothetical protein
LPTGVWPKEADPHAEAEPLFTRSLAITEKALGPDHIDVGTPLISLAGPYYVQGRYAEAEPAAITGHHHEGAGSTA